MKLKVNHTKYCKTRYNSMAVFIFFILIYSNTILYAKSENANTYLRTDISFDSIMCVLNDKNVSFDIKYSLTYKLKFLPYKQRIEIFNNIIDQAKQYKDNNKLLRLYSHTALYYVYSFQMNEAGLMLNEASMYVGKATDSEALGIYHFSAGSYYNQAANEKEAHEHFFKAMPYFEQSDALEEKLIPLYFSLAFSYAQRRDIHNLKKIIDKMLPEALSKNNPDDLINTYTVVSHYYSYLFEKNPLQKSYLDSAIIYDTKAIRVFELMENPPEPFKNHIASTYVNLAENRMKLLERASDSISYYLDKIKEYANPLDTVILINYHWIKGNLFFEEKKFKEAESEFNIQLSLLANETVVKDYSVYVGLYDMLAKIYKIEGNYYEAFKYECLKSECKDSLNNKESYGIIQSLMSQYEAEKKEQEIQKLTEQTRYHRLINILTGGICVFLAAAFIFFIRWTKLRRKSISDRLKISEKEKEEAELISKLREEQLARTELEKYEALLDVHFKGLEIGGKNDELTNLQKEKESLVAQLERYSEKVRTYEADYNKKRLEEVSNEKFSEYVIKEVKEAIAAGFAGNSLQREKYIRKFDKLKLENDFFVWLENKYVKEILSLISVEYCVCISVGMDIKAIALCFDVEVESVRQTRNRIKKRLQVDKAIDLDFYIQSLLKNNN